MFFSCMEGFRVWPPSRDRTLKLQQLECGRTFETLVEAGGGRNDFHGLAVGLIFLLFPTWSVSNTSQTVYLPSPKCHINPQRSSRFPPMWFELFSDNQQLWELNLGLSPTL